MSERWSVIGLSEARRLEAKPPCIPNGRPRGVKRLGVLFEKAAERALLPVGAHRGVWWEFVDSHGHGYCQTDLLVVQKRHLVVIECKLSWKPEAWSKLRGLYSPVVEMATGQKVLCVQMCKFINGNTLESGPVVNSLEDAIGEAEAGRSPTLHWMGKGTPLRHYIGRASQAVASAHA